MQLLLQKPYSLVKIGNEQSLVLHCALRQSGQSAESESQPSGLEQPSRMLFLIIVIGGLCSISSLWFVFVVLGVYWVVVVIVDL